MSLFDQLKGGLASKLGGTNVSGILDHAMSLINNPATGGLPGFIEAFKNKGLGDIVSSWISTGENKPISPDQIKQALGSDKIQQIAEKLGISKDLASQHLSDLLPQIIDKLTPNGKLPEEGKLGEALSLLKSAFLKPN
ncbi:MAG TPA: YidB family protein [Nitrospirota bacterium]|nr:YidB family protein [Nitrospirota bacterium]